MMVISDTVQFFWDFDMQQSFKVYGSDEIMTLLAQVGTDFNNDFDQTFRTNYSMKGIPELIYRKDFINRDQGFSLGRCIRDDNLKIVMVWDEKKKRMMRAMPDLADYRNDTIVDLKTVFFRKPLRQGDRFLTEKDLEGVTIPNDDLPEDFQMPDGYANAMTDFKKEIEGMLIKKYASQIKRYREAYTMATKRSPTIVLYPIVYAKIDEYDVDPRSPGFERE